MTERKICDEAAVLRLSELCPNWPNCKATLKTGSVRKEGFFNASPDKLIPTAIGYFCDCEPKK